MKKCVGLMLVVAVAGLVAGGCTKKEEAAPAIKIGVAGPHTGDLAPYGIPTKEAAEMVAAKANAAGGVLGRQIELIALDDQCKPEIATNVATKLVTEEVSVVIGHVCSGATKAARGIYKEAGIVAISTSATTPPSGPRRSRSFTTRATTGRASPTSRRRHSRRSRAWKSSSTKG